MKYKAVIFDLDGVIVSTDTYHYHAWKHMANNINVHFDEQINNRLRGVSRMESLEIVLERSDDTFTQEEKETLAEGKNKSYKMLLKQLNPADVPGEIIEVLQKLRDNSVKIAIGSSSKNAKFILEQIGLTDMFDAISDGTMIKNSKPDPEVFLIAADMLNVAPDECVVVEDAKAGIIAAKRAGMTAVAIHDAKDSEEADYCINSLSELLSLFDK